MEVSGFFYYLCCMKIVLEKGQSLFFTSDTHYNHSNICRATTKWSDADNLTRDFKSLDHMNDTLVNKINELVGENDILIHLGDWSFGGLPLTLSDQVNVNGGVPELINAVIVPPEPVPQPVGYKEYCNGVPYDTVTFPD